MKPKNKTEYVNGLIKTGISLGITLTTIAAIKISCDIYSQRFKKILLGENKTITYNDKAINTSLSDLYSNYMSDNKYHNKMLIEKENETTKIIDNIGERSLNNPNFLMDFPEKISITTPSSKLELNAQELFTKKQRFQGINKIRPDTTTYTGTMQKIFIDKSKEYNNLRKKFYLHKNIKK